ncbi:MAG: cysteine desulfurase [Kiritimatiellaceae bacterium]|nr:cysteine desulfurase [Kiritimatiellaceae bacterium]
MSTLARQIAADFPILGKKVNGHPLTYLDTAATALKPLPVIESVTHAHRELSANVHRGVHQLSREATDAFDRSRETVQKFLNAFRSEEIVFTSGTTASINIVANTWGRSTLKAGDEIVLSHMEHHSNIVPWQMLCQVTGCVIKVAPINDRGELIMEEFKALLNERTRLVAVNYVSNALGTINPVKEIVVAAHAVGALVLVDAAQAVACLPVDVQDLDCDFLAFSAHKLFGPTGVGVLYAKYALLKSMPPYFGGGDMILSVTFEKTIYNEPPYKFEAGTPNIAGVIGLGRAIEYVTSLGFDAIGQHEKMLLKLASDELSRIEGVRLIGTAREKVSIVSFVIDQVHPHDIGSILDSEGVAIRAGHHCTQPVMARFCIPATARASFSIYNTEEDVARLVGAVHQVRKVML